MMIRRSAIPTFLILIALAGSAGMTRAAKGDALPYRLALAVDYGEQPGKESWREEFEYSIVEHIDALRCFRSVRRFDPENAEETDLLLHVTISNVIENQTFDISQNQLYDPDAPPDTEKQFMLEIEADFELRLRKLPEDVTVRRKRFALHETYRPRLNEDARYAIRRQVVEKVDRALVNLACKSSEKKLLADIEKAMAKKPN